MTTRLLKEIKARTLFDLQTLEREAKNMGTILDGQRIAVLKGFIKNAQQKIYLIEVLEKELGTYTRVRPKTIFSVCRRF